MKVEDIEALYQEMRSKADVMIELKNCLIWNERILYQGL